MEWYVVLWEDGKGAHFDCGIRMRVGQVPPVACTCHHRRSDQVMKIFGFSEMDHLPVSCCLVKLLKHCPYLCSCGFFYPTKKTEEIEWRPM